MATAGEFENLSTESKNVYGRAEFDAVQNTVDGDYRKTLKNRTNDYGMNEGIVKFPMRTKGMWSVGIIADNAAFPAPKDPTNLQGELTPELFAASIQVGLKTKYALKSGKSSFKDGGVTADRIEEISAELASYRERVYAGTHRGRLAVVESDGTNNFVASKTAGTSSLGTLLLEEGMVLEAYTAHSGGSVRDSFSAHRITAIDHDTRTVTYVLNSTGANDDRTLVAGDSIYASGQYARTPVTMPDIVDDGTAAGTIFGASRTTHPKLKAQVRGNGGALRDQTEQLILEVIEQVRRRTGKKITRALANGGQCRKYVEFVSADRRYPGATTGTQSYSVGYGDDSLTIAAPGVNCKLEYHPFVPPREIDFLSWDTFFLYEAKPLDWLEEDELFHLVPTDGGHKSALLAYIGAVENQGNLMPAAQGKLADLKDPICGDA